MRVQFRGVLFDLGLWKGTIRVSSEDKKQPVLFG